MQSLDNSDEEFDFLAEGDRNAELRAGQKDVTGDDFDLFSAEDEEDFSDFALKVSEAPAPAPAVRTPAMPYSVVGKQPHGLVGAPRVPRFEGMEDRFVGPGPLPPQQILIGDALNEGMLEQVRRPLSSQTAPFCRTRSDTGRPSDAIRFSARHVEAKMQLSPGASPASTRSVLASIAPARADELQPAPIDRHPPIRSRDDINWPSGSFAPECPLARRRAWAPP